MVERRLVLRSDGDVKLVLHVVFAGFPTAAFAELEADAVLVRRLRLGRPVVCRNDG